MVNAKYLIKILLCRLRRIQIEVIITHIAYIFLAKFKAVDQLVSFIVPKSKQYKQSFYHYL